MRKLTVRFIFMVAGMSAASTVYAQPLTPTINPTANPIVVSTAPEKVVAPVVVAANRVLFNMALGATALGGNTKAYAGNLGGRLGLSRAPHQLTVEALGSMGAARQGGLTNVQWTARNVISRARYDLFMSQNDALFAALAPRRDVFAGLDLRLQHQVGYLRNLMFAGENHRLWSELGYDFTYDKLSVESTATTDITGDVRTAAPGLVPTGTSQITRTIKTRKPGEADRVHSARLFLGYTNRVASAASVSVGVETLFDLTDRRNTRVTGLAELTSSISQSFKLGVQSRMMYDHKPVPTKDPIDVIAAVQLVYAFDSTAVAAPACAPCDCTDQVQEARDACRSEEAASAAEAH